MLKFFGRYMIGGRSGKRERARVVFLLWAWHVHDKRQTVGVAREGFVRQFELTAAQAELDAIRRRMAAADEANQALREKCRRLRAKRRALPLNWRCLNVRLKSILLALLIMIFCAACSQTDLERVDAAAGAVA